MKRRLPNHCSLGVKQGVIDLVQLGFVLGETPIIWQFIKTQCFHRLME